MDGSSELRTTSWTLTQGFRRLRVPSAFTLCYSVWIEFVLSSRLWPPPYHSDVSHCPGYYSKEVGTGDCGSDPPTSPWDHPSGLPGPGCYWCLPPSIVPRVLLVEGWWFFAFASSFSLWHQRHCPVWGVTTLYTTLERFCVALRCRTEVFIIDVPGPSLDVY